MARMDSRLDLEVSWMTLVPEDKKENPVSGQQVLPKFILECSGLHDKDNGSRPRKRARLDASEDITPPSHQHQIVLARFNIDIRTGSTPNFVQLAQAIQVGLVGVRDLEDSRLRLEVLGPSSRKKGPRLIIDSAGPVPRHVSDGLKQVATLERRARGSGKPGVCKSMCRLRGPAEPTGDMYTLECSTSWLDGESAFGPSAKRKEDYDILTHYYPESGGARQKSWSPQDFYASVHSPAIDAPVPETVHQKVLETELYPFQKRAVAWMLERESPKTDSKSNLLSYESAKDADKHPCFISHLEGSLCSAARLPGTDAEPRGGVLAEEMGLGKTCELIALMCLNKREPPLTDSEAGGRVSPVLLPSQATLIVTPPTILQQWKDELARHAPGLSVLHYKGISDVTASKGGKSILEDFATRDVVLTTYAVLGKEVHYVVDPPERSLRRRERRHDRPRSPLMKMHWWRVCLDEAQMVESGVSAAARVASLLPRENCWAVTGTPLKKDVQDLFGLLVFLRYRPFCDSSTVWTRLIQKYGDIFRQVFGKIALRHTKDQIRDELRLPPQRRIVLTSPFTQVEEQNYKTLFEAMCEECGCAPDGSPLSDEWDPDSPVLLEKMRGWLVRLRQTCLHPRVGRNRKALGRGQAPLRTVAEVLEVMIEQTETSIRTESRLAITTQLLRGHIIGNAKDDKQRALKALDIYERALRESDAIVADCRADVERAGAVEDKPVNTPEDSEDERSPEQVSKGGYKAALHSSLQTHHAAYFFVGTAYFQIKSNTEITEPDSDRFRELEGQETLHYDAAKMIRKELLQENAVKSERLMRTVQQGKDDAALQKPSRLASMDTPGGVENVKLVYKARDLGKVLNAQARLINEWKEKAEELLLKPLVDEDEEGIETTGDEYEDSTKQQDTLYAYIDALRAVVADRSTCITGQSAPLIDHEMSVLGREAAEGNGHAPELMLKLLAQRSKLRQRPDDFSSLRGLVHEARSIETSLQWSEGNSRADAEMHIVRDQIKQLQDITSEESKILSKLEKMMDLFRSTMNQRLEFYRQLQYISDTVAPYKEDWDETLDLAALNVATTRQETQAKSLAALKTKNRFLLHLRDESNKEESQRICVICRDTFEQGVLTVCGHQYCKECIHHWWNAHRTCPVCKRRLNLADFHQITYKPRELRAQEEIRTEPSSPSQPHSSNTSTSPSLSIYSDMGSETAAQIKSIDLNGSFGTKIDTLARHMLWIRSHDAGAKAIVFSQFREFLDVLATAFSQFGIGYSRMGRANAVTHFKSDPSVECFLLDAKTDSSGLNLVNAQYVFLAEPLINTAIELQAIARVHRIGQLRPTTVYMYLIGDTVEEAIYDISVTRRLSHMQDRRRRRRRRSVSATPALGEAAIDAANSLELQQAPASSKLLVQGKGGGELVANDDLWACLFGKSSRSAGVSLGASEAVRTEVNRHLRAETAETRRD